MTTENDSQGSNVYVRTRILLALWSLGNAQEAVKRGELMKKVVPGRKRVSDYTEFLVELEREGAIAINKTKISLVVPNGMKLLAENLRDPAMAFEGTIVGSWVANSLLKWIGQSGSDFVGETGNTKGDGNSQIDSYEGFKSVALEVYNQLNQDYNFDHLVPIYRIRREIGDRTSRSQFNEWMLKMQADDIFQYMEGTVEDSAPDKIQDSLTTPLSGLRCYAKLL